MRVYWSFLIIMTSVILWIIPFTEAGHDFKTDLREDNFTVETAAGVTSANVTFFKELYENDTSSIDLYSHLTTDTPLVSTYNGTSRVLNIIGLTDNTTRALDVTYDTPALSAIGVFATLIDKFPFIWILMTIPLPILALVLLIRNWKGI